LVEALRYKTERRVLSEFFGLCVT